MIGTSFASFTLALSLVSAGPLPPLEKALEEGPIAVLEIPDASKSLQTLERSSFRRWVPLMFGSDADVVRGAGLRLLSAWYGTQASGPDIVLGADAQRRAAELRDVMRRWWSQLGFEAAAVREREGWSLHGFEGRGFSVTVAAQLEHGRVGWATVSSRAESLGAARVRPLASDAAFRGMVAHAPRADLRGILHVPRLFGWLLKQPGGEITARLIARLGLAGMQEAPFALELSSRREARLRAETELQGDTRGAVDALGPPLAVRWPEGVPDDARGFVVASVIPAKVLRGLIFYLSADNPVQLTLAQAQLAALEGEVDKRLDGDVLGLAPRRWSVHVDARGALVARLPVADPGGAQALVAALARAYPALSVKPSSWGEVAGFRVARGGTQVAIAFAADAVWVSADERAVARALAVEPPEDRPPMLLDGEAVVFGQGRDALRGLAKRLGLPAPNDKSTDRSAFRIERAGPRFSWVARTRR